MKIPSMFSDYMSEFIKKISQHHPIGQFPNLTEHLNFFKVNVYELLADFFNLISIS